MKKKTLGIAALAITTAVVVTACATFGKPDERWADYKNWTKITDGRVSTGDPTGFIGNVHAGPSGYREIYVNSTGLATNQGSAPYNYPAGTVIVKEQYASKAAWEAQKSPDLTIMVKVADSDQPDAANWQWSPSYTSAPAKNEFCAGCHAIAAKDDFVFTNEDFFKTQ